ncbi:hypothetical protein ABDB91_18790 [Desulfoscipio sp. XC116]|uniref:hypothetical protein n=1 Tax=Desulfoscipio sp. XC116 TaxID=3144975 RepID=UPI00325B720E
MTTKMDKKKLSQLYQLNRDYNKLSQKLLDLKFEQADSVLNGGGVTDQEDLEAMIRVVKKQRDLAFTSCLYELKRIYRYLDTVSDSRMRLILSLRYINALSWSQVAACINNGLTADDVKKMHDRFLS